MRYFICIIAIIALPVISEAQNSGFDFKGTPLGSSVAQLKEKHPEFYCENTPGGVIGDSTCRLAPEIKCLVEKSGIYSDERTCRDAVTKAKTYAGAQSEIFLMFYGDKLCMVRISFSADRFVGVVAALREKHGNPAEIKSEPVSNRMGATFENQIQEWKSSGATIQAEKYASRVDRSSVKVFVDSYLIEFAQRKGTKDRQGAKDL